MADLWTTDSSIAAIPVAEFDLVFEDQLIGEGQFEGLKGRADARLFVAAEICDDLLLAIRDISDTPTAGKDTYFNMKANTPHVVSKMDNICIEGILTPYKLLSSDIAGWDRGERSRSKIRFIYLSSARLSWQGPNNNKTIKYDAP